jgi:hypothetical protein
LPEGLRIIGSSAFYRANIKTISPCGENEVIEENSIILPNSLVYIMATSLNTMFKSNSVINRFVVPSNVVEVSSRSFENINAHIIEMSFGDQSKGSGLTYINDTQGSPARLYEIDNVPTTGTLTPIIGLYGGAVDSIIFYYNSTSKKNAFENIANNSTLFNFQNAGTIPQITFVQANDFIS